MQVLAQFSSWSPASHKQSQESKDRSLSAIDFAPLLVFSQFGIRTFGPVPDCSS